MRDNPLIRTNIKSYIRIQACQIKNRLGLGPINTGLFEKDGDLSPSKLSFYSQYFREHLGLVYVGGVAVSRNGKSNSNSLLLNSQSMTKGLRKVVSAAKLYDTRIAVQLMHAGRQTRPEEINAQIIAPSAIPCPVVNVMPNELDQIGIREIIEEFGLAAKLAEESGVDLIELHGAHGYLISGFLSPYSNKRSDSYGGSLENRFRFLDQILNEVNSRVSVPIGVRLNCYENVQNGLTLEEVIHAVKSIIGNKISFVSISAGVYAVEDDIIIPSRKFGTALWRSQSSKLKKHLDMPIMLAGNIDSIDLSNSILGEGDTDIILMVRALLSDPCLLSKTISGREDEIQECTDCGECKYHSRGKAFVFCPCNKILTDLHRRFDEDT